MRRVCQGIVSGLAVLFVYGCGGGSGSAGRVTLDPTNVTLSQGETKAFSVTVKQCTDTRINWRVSEGDAGGTVTSDGVYTAPSTAGTYHVVATCDTDSSVSDTATVTVN